MVEPRVRDAGPEDLAFLVVLAAMFGQAPEGPAVVGWKREDSDFGLLALDENQVPIGAAWWRLATGPSEGEPWPDMREVFLGVTPARQREGIGPFLLDQLIEEARADPALRRLVGRIIEDPGRATKIEEMLTDRPSSTRRNWRWHPHPRADGRRPSLAQGRLSAATWAARVDRSGSDLVIDAGDGSPVNPDSMSSAWRFLVLRNWTACTGTRGTRATSR